MRSALFLLVILDLSWRCFSQDPIIAPRDIFTRGGCNITSECSANNAMTVVWSPTRTGSPFVNTSTRFETTIPPINGTLTAILMFINISSEDDGDYSCIIIGNNNQGFSVNTIRVIVANPDPISITSIANYSLNNLTTDDSLTVGCVIQTCGSPNVVNFTRQGSPTPEESIVRANNDGALRDIAFNWNPQVRSELVGTYYCTAENPLGTASQMFIISGTPREPAGKSGSGGCNKNTYSGTFLISLLLSSLAIIYY